MATAANQPMSKALPVVVAIDMGYGHLRAAAPIAERLGVPVLEADHLPLADADEQKMWARARRWYGVVTRLSQIPFAGAPLRRLVDDITSIEPLHPLRDLSKPNAGARTLDRLARNGLGKRLAEEVKREGAPLVTTFYSPAILAERHGVEKVFCVVTDSDINRVWAPMNPAQTRIRYLCPTPRVVRRLAAYGVPAANLVMTGFPLPHELLGGSDLPVLKKNLAARIVRLDPAGAFRDAFGKELDGFLGELPLEERGKAPLLVFAVGGTGAQTGLVHRFLRSLREPIREGKLRLALVAGIRADTAAELKRCVQDAVLDDELKIGRIEILFEQQLASYFARFHELLARADILWTKPSELTFYGALGLPLIFAPAIGVHERYNQRWAVECGAGFGDRVHQLHAMAGWLFEWLQDGTLAGAAWSAAMRMPKSGLYRIVDLVRS